MRSVRPRRQHMGVQFVSAVAAAVQGGVKLALPPMQLRGHGTCAIYLQGGNEHGLWLM